MGAKRFLDSATEVVRSLRHGATLRRQTPEVILHVGAHKTATSLIQKFAQHRRLQLRALRLHSIDRGELGKLIGWGDLVNENPAPLRDRVQRELTRPWVNQLLISYENSLGRPFMRGKRGLYPAAERGLTGLRAALEGVKVTVVLSIRPQAEFVESYYLQRVNEGQAGSFQRWTSQLNLDCLHWLPVAQTAASVFGASNVRVIDFRVMAEGQPAFLRHFFEVAAPTLRLEPCYDRVHNPGLSRAGLDIALAANPHIRNLTQRARLRAFLRENFSTATQSRAVFLSEKERARLNHRFESDYLATLAVGTSRG